MPGAVKKRGPVLVFTINANRRPISYGTTAVIFMSALNIIKVPLRLFARNADMTDSETFITDFDFRDKRADLMPENESFENE